MGLSALSRIAVLFVVVVLSVPLMGCLEIEEIPDSEQNVRVGYKIVGNETIYKETRLEKGQSFTGCRCIIHFSRFFNISDGDVVSISVSLSSDWMKYWNMTPTNVTGTLEVTHEHPDDAFSKKYSQDMNTMNRTPGTAPDWKNITWITANISEEMTMTRGEAERYVSDFSDGELVGEWELNFKYKELYRGACRGIGIMDLNWTVQVDVEYYGPVIIGE